MEKLCNLLPKKCTTLFKKLLPTHNYISPESSTSNHLLTQIILHKHSHAIRRNSKQTKFRNIASNITKVGNVFRRYKLNDKRSRFNIITKMHRWLCTRYNIIKNGAYKNK